MCLSVSTEITAEKTLQIFSLDLIFGNYADICKQVTACAYSRMMMLMMIMMMIMIIVIIIIIIITSTVHKNYVSFGTVLSVNL